MLHSKQGTGLNQIRYTIQQLVTHGCDFIWT